MKQIIVLFTDDSIVVVSVGDTTKHTSVKDKLSQKYATCEAGQPWYILHAFLPRKLSKGAHSWHKHAIVVYPDVIQHEQDEPLLTKEAKGIQTENFSMKFDEGTQCEDEKVIVHTQGVQTSPGTSSDIDSGNSIKRHPVQSLPFTTTTMTVTTPLMQTTSSQFSTDAVTLIVSTAAAAAVAASTSLHNNDKYTKVCMLEKLRLSCTLIFDLFYFIIFLLFPKLC